MFLPRLVEIGHEILRFECRFTFTAPDVCQRTGDNRRPQIGPFFPERFEFVVRLPLSEFMAVNVLQ